MNLGDRMKQYESVSKTGLIHRMPVIIRLDGCHFHTFTKGFEKPFDEILMSSMMKTMKCLCSNIQGCVFGYTESDEISLVLIDYKKLNSSAWYDNEVQKICSVAASLCTLAFNRIFRAEVHSHVPEYFNDKEKGKCLSAYNKALECGATFDCRAFNLPKEEVCNYFIWRQQDATRNSIQSLAQSKFSHKELQGLSCDKLQDKLFNECGINWNDLETFKKRGTSCFNTGSDWTVDLNMPILTQDRDYINKHIFIECE